MNWPVQTQVKVRFADVDSMGHVNNAKYFTYFEQARVGYFAKIPVLDFKNYREAGVSVILASIQCQFLSPAFLDEVLTVKIRIREMKRSSFVMDYEMTEKETGRKVATGESVQVYFDYQKQKSLEIPPGLRKEFEKIEGRDL